MTIAIANHKGGVGKTTTTASVGMALAMQGKRVLLVDLDPQSNLTGCFFADEAEKTVYDSFVDKQPLPILHAKDNLDLVASSLDMSYTEIAISTRMRREYILKDLLSKVSSNYDYILLDCPPSLGLITINALVAADELYIPLTAEAMPTKGLKMLVDVVEQVRECFSLPLQVGGVIFTRWESTKLAKGIEAIVKESFGDAVFSTKIRKNISLAEAPLESVNIFDYAPDSNGAKDYMSLTKEILTRHNCK